MERKEISANCVQHAERGKIRAGDKIDTGVKTKSSDFNLIVVQTHVRAKVNIVTGLM